ncbi:carbonic anhydrase [Mycena floridula]|nr:carbonic anhydrase [Mycena floridula]
MSAAAFVTKNEKYASGFTKGSLPMPPAKKLLIVACMDARVTPAESLGIELGEAHIVRNAGGCARDAVRNIVISQRLLGTREIAVFHHTDCGMLTFSSSQLRDIVKKETAGDEVAQAVDAIDFLEFNDVEASVKEDVEFLKNHPLVLKGTTVTGWIDDVKTGKVSQVA